MSPYFAPWEIATHVVTQSQPGILGRSFALPLTVVATLAFALVLWPVMGWGALVVGAVFGRLLALDLTTYTLPNIYTVPLLAVGFVSALFSGLIVQTLVAWGCLLLAGVLLHNRAGVRYGFGGGDIKLMAAMLAFLPLANVFFAIALECLAWLPVAFAKPKVSIPFGVPLLVGWAVVLRWPHMVQGLPNWLMSSIS